MTITSELVLVLALLSIISFVVPVQTFASVYFDTFATLFVITGLFVSYFNKKLFSSIASNEETFQVPVFNYSLHR